MPKKKDDDQAESTSGEQLDLIEVGPENAKTILEAAKLYKKYQVARISALEKEKAQKQKVLALVHEADLKPLEGGVVRFNCGGYIVTVTPRDELIKVKDAKEE